MPEVPRRHISNLNVSAKQRGSLQGAIPKKVRAKKIRFVADANTGASKSPKTPGRAKRNAGAKQTRLVVRNGMLLVVVKSDAEQVANASDAGTSGAAVPVASAPVTSAPETNTPITSAAETDTPETNMPITSAAETDTPEMVPVSCVVQDAPPLNTESCLLCGKILTGMQQKRRKPVRFFREVLQKYWAKTDVIWKAVWDVCCESSESETIAMCMPCVHWTGRSTNARTAKKEHKEMLPMDALREVVENPGSPNAPDERLFMRFAESLASAAYVNGVVYSNPYTQFFPPWALDVLTNSHWANVPDKERCKQMKRKLLAAWWEANGRTLVMPDRHVARLIRRELSVAINTEHDKLMCTPLPATNDTTCEQNSAGMDFT